MKILKETFDPDFNEGLQKYIGKPLKELLKDIDGRLQVDYKIVNGVDFYGASGGVMLVNQIAWDLADATIVKAVSSDRYSDLNLELSV